MDKPIRRVSRSQQSTYRGLHRFEHWGVDNQIYFITARVRGQFHAFACDEAKAVFWDRFTHYAEQFGFESWVTSLLDNHYHTMGLLKQGGELGVMMQRVHGSVAKLVNDVLEGKGPARPTSVGCVLDPRVLGRDPLKRDAPGNPGRGPGVRWVPFWREIKGKEYFDGCIRHEKQFARAYRYTLTQSVRHGVCADWREYAHTRVTVEMDEGLRRALAGGFLMQGRGYRRYMRNPREWGG